MSPFQVLRGHYAHVVLRDADIGADPCMGRDVVHKRSRGPHSLRVVVARNFYREQFRPHVGKSTVQQASLAALFITPFLLYKLIKTLKRARRGEFFKRDLTPFPPAAGG